jgi:hypothetical protein
LRSPLGHLAQNRYPAAMPAVTKFQRYRDAKHKRGLRLLRRWVPDVSRPKFAAEAERQAKLLRGRPEERDALEFIKKAFAWPSAR